MRRPAMPSSPAPRENTGACRMPGLRTSIVRCRRRVAGQAGRYVSLPNRIMAVPMTEPFEVLLADGISRLSGRAGEWLVDYGDGSLGIVSQGIFATTYEIVD